MNEIKQELLELNFNVDSIGIVMWIDAIEYVREHKLWWDILDIYEYLAKKYDSTPSKVERNLRTAIAPAKDSIRKKYNYYKPIKNVTFLNLIKFELI